MLRNEKKKLSVIEKENFLGNFFKSKREEKGLTITEVAKLSKFKNLTKVQKNISEIEDCSTIYKEYIEELSRIYEISFDDLGENISKHKNINDAIIAKNEIILAELELEKAKSYLKIIDQLPLLLKHYNRIMNDQTMYFIPVKNTSIGAAYVGMIKNKLVLGEILKLWKDGDWVGECNDCGNETAFVFAAGGSPLSGAGSGWGVCSSCRKTAYQIRSFSKFFRSVRALPKKKSFQSKKGSRIKSFDELIVLLGKKKNKK